MLINECVNLQLISSTIGYNVKKVSTRDQEPFYEMDKKVTFFKKVQTNKWWEISCYKRFGIGQKHMET